MSNNDLKNKLAEINVLVEPAINQLLAQDLEQYTAEVARYQCGVGGKRIRPALVILSGQVFGGRAEDLIYPAASVEILHNATLIIDDIIDHSEFRRNEPTCWSKFGQSIAECASFMYLSSVFSGINLSDSRQKLIDLYSSTLKVIIDGEIKDILFERSGRENDNFVTTHRYREISKDDYFKMIGQKTAELLQTCCKAGAIISNANEEQTAIIGGFGFNLGMAFQIRDDILDVFGDEKEFGKKIGKDIIEKKMGNIIILSAIDKLEQWDRDMICNILTSSKEVSDEDVATVTALVEKTGARQEAEDTANSFIQKAFDALEKLPKNEYNETLKEIAKYIVDRKN